VKSKESDGQTFSICSLAKNHHKKLWLNHKPDQYSNQANKEVPD